MPKPLPLTLEITRGSCRVRVYGKRSTKGWTIIRTDGAKSEPQGHRKAKEDAIQLALDCCEPDTARFFTVKPA